LEVSDSERFQTLVEDCDKLVPPEINPEDAKRLFHCGVGRDSFVLSYDGLLRLCPVLCHPDCVYDFREGSLADAWQNFIPKVLSITTDRQEFLDGCRVCSLIDLCMWCPAHAYLETGYMDKTADYFCETAHARAKSLKDA
jgi:radical SAM protein with 4Fe4S-binding SPASM domain